MNSECKTCKRPVLWLRNDKTGKVAPIDARPDPFGNVLILPDDRYRVMTKAEQDQTVREDRHTSHWCTCPDRADWKQMRERR